MECSGYYAQESGLLGTRWRGVRFENARHKKDLVQEHTLYVKVNTQIYYYYFRTGNRSSRHHF